MGDGILLRHTLLVSAVVVFVAAVMWAWSISSDVSAIKAELRATNELRAAELEDIRRRLDRHDALLDRLFNRTAQ